MANFQNPSKTDALLLPLAKDTNGRPTYVRESDGVVSVATYSASGAAVERGSAAILYLAQRGPINYQPGTWQGAVGFGDRIIAVDNAGTFWKWVAATGWAQISAASAIPGTISVFFVDSRGDLYYNASSAPRELRRSTDDGATWSLVLTLPGSSDDVAPMCEDDLGHLYVGAYGSDSGGSPNNSRTLWKSADGGATWANISAAMPGGSSAIHRHIHGVWWDNHRKLLYLSHGDSGATSVPYVSDDRGATWSALTGAGQCTAIIGTSTHVIFAGDGWLGGGDRRVYRTACSDKASLIANAKTVSYDWMADGGLAANDSTVNGFAWFGFEDNQGNVLLPYGKEGTRTAVLASTDSGATWAELLTGAGGGRLFFDQCYVSPLHPTRDGFCYSFDSTLSSVSQWRVYRPGSSITVDPSAPPYIRDGISAPCAGMFDGELRSAGVLQRLAGDITTPLRLGVSGVTLDRRSYLAGRKLVSAPVVTETFEGTPSGWTGSVNGVGVNTLNDTTRAFAGTQSYKSDLSGGSGITYAQIRRTTAPWTAVASSEIWFDARIWVAAITSQNLTILEWENTRITLRTVNSINRLGVFNTETGNNPGFQQDHEAVAFPAGAWVRVKIAIVAHNTNGRVRIWQDTGTGMRLVLDLMGLITDGSTIGQNLWIGARTESSGNYTTVWYDDVKLGFNQDPSSPAALTMATGSALLPDGIYA